MGNDELLEQLLALDHINHDIKNLSAIHRIVHDIQRWLKGDNDEAIRDIILTAAWLYTRDGEKSRATVAALDKIKEMSK